MSFVTSSYWVTSSFTTLSSSICCTPEILNISLSGSCANINFTLPTESCCISCSAVTVERSSDGINWTGSNTQGCTSPFCYPTGSLPTGSTTYFRMYQNCSGSVTSSYSNTGSLFIPGPDTGSCFTDFIIRNGSCGGGYIYDVGINGFFMGSLDGPSNFPLSSTLYGTKANPNGVDCGQLNTIQLNVTTNLPGTGNCAMIYVEINGGARTYQSFFTTNPYPQITGVLIENGDTVEVIVYCYPGPC